MKRIQNYITEEIENHEGSAKDFVPEESVSKAQCNMLNDLAEKIKELEDYQKHLLTHCRCDEEQGSSCNGEPCNHKPEQDSKSCKEN